MEKFWTMRETDFARKKETGVELVHPAANVLTNMNRTKANALEELDQGVLPLMLMQQTFHILLAGHEETVARVQLPLTPIYAFTIHGPSVIQSLTLRHDQVVNLVVLSIFMWHCHVWMMRFCAEKLLACHPNECLRIGDDIDDR